MIATITVPTFTTGKISHMTNKIMPWTALSGGKPARVDLWYQQQISGFADSFTLNVVCLYQGCNDSPEPVRCNF